MSTNARLLSYLRPYRKRIVMVGVCMVVLAILNALTIGLLQPLIDLLFPPANGHISLVPEFVAKQHYSWVQMAETYAVNNRIFVFKLFCAFLLVAAFFRFIFTYIQQYLMEFLAEKVMLDIRTRIYSHMHTLSLKYYTSRDTGSLMSRLTVDVEVIGRALVFGLGEMAKEPLVMLSLLFLMFSNQWKLSLIVLVFFPLVVYPLIRFGQKIKHQSRKLQEEQAQLYKLLNETISGIRIVKAFGMEDYERKRFSKRIGEIFKATVKIIRFSALSSPLTEFLGVVGIVAVLAVAAWFVALGDLTVGKFSTFLVALFSFYQPLKRLSAANNQYQKGMGGAERVFQLLDTPPDVVEKPNAPQLPLPRKEIKFDHVTFSYDGEAPVLEDISVTFPLNKVIAIVGPSGAGKTTLVNLLPRFYEVSQGSISIDGKDIRDVTIHSLRDKMGIVTQETILFDDTIYNNIAYGRPDYSEEKVYAAAKIANADDFIRQLPEGYQTLVGERGVKLSGGQKQRLTIARAVLKNPPILILDEATSSLDAESERLVQDALDKLMVNRTTFVIAHRLSTILNADIIVVLEKGKLVEMGTHAELVEKKGLYWRLYQTQFADIE
jgi:subfamily B ATP-binding cassette protein MsbA